jgi:hypothetical protein
MLQIFHLIITWFALFLKISLPSFLFLLLCMYFHFSLCTLRFFFLRTIFRTLKVCCCIFTNFVYSLWIIEFLGSLIYCFYELTECWVLFSSIWFFVFLGGVGTFIYSHIFSNGWQRPYWLHSKLFLSLFKVSLLYSQILSMVLTKHS